MRGKDDGAAKYTVRVYLASIEQQPAGLFDLSLQGQVVAKAIAVPAAADTAVNRVLVKEFTEVSVDETLKVELNHHDDQRPGTIAAIEVIRE